MSNGPRRYGANYANDRAEIQDLQARYMFAIDYLDWDSYVANFTEDGELEFARGTAMGRENIKKALIAFADVIPKHYHTADGKMAALRHVPLQAVIRVEGDRAWGRMVWAEMANHGPGDTAKLATYGVNEDEYRKVDGRWLFAKRRILNEFLDGRKSGPINPVREMDAIVEASLGK